MDRPTRAQQRAAAIDISPARLAEAIHRLTRERDTARRAATAARTALEQLRAAVDASGGELDAARAERDAARTERDEYLAALQRERAEFQNFKRRSAEERQATLGLAAEGLIAKVLALADDFDRALEHRPEAIAEDAWVEGITAIDRKLRQLIESEGVTAIDAAPGLRFDPREHEAVANVSGTGRPGGEIVEELRRGYRLRERVIRPALVVVAVDDGPEPAAAAGPDDATEADDTSNESSTRIH